MVTEFRSKSRRHKVPTLPLKVDVHAEEGMAEPPEQELQETYWLS